MRVFPFEELDPTLPLLPLSARRALDVVGRKLSLSAWITLPLSARQALATAGSGDAVDADAVRALLEGVETSPAEVVCVAQPAAAEAWPIAARWDGLDALAQYALHKLSTRRPERYEAALNALVGRRLARMAPTASLDDVVGAVRHPRAGGIASFLGVVRDHAPGRHAVTRLDYEAYGAMADRQLVAICDGVEREWPGSRTAVIHRVGELSVGDVAVVCAASAPHRAQAFEACRALIDRVKADVPIWKRELGPDGAEWVGWERAS